MSISATPITARRSPNNDHEWCLHHNQENIAWWSRIVKSHLPQETTFPSWSVDCTNSTLSTKIPAGLEAVHGDSAQIKTSGVTRVTLNYTSHPESYGWMAILKSPWSSVGGRPSTCWKFCHCPENGDISGPTSLLVSFDDVTFYVVHGSTAPHIASGESLKVTPRHRHGNTDSQAIWCKYHRRQKSVSLRLTHRIWRVFDDITLSSSR